MGFGGISPWSLLLILLIVVMIFGTKRLKNMGGDVGGAIKNFKKSMANAQDDEEPKQIDSSDEGRVVEGKVKDKKEV